MNLIFGTLVMPQPLVHRGEEKRANFFFWNLKVGALPEHIRRRMLVLTEKRAT